MKRFWLAIFALALGFYCVSTPAQWNGCKAGFCSPVVASTGYQGPGDVFGAAFAWYSCSRGYSAAYAAPGTNGACDVVDTATGLVTCTFHVGTSGFVNPTECNATACATSCKLTKAYDQSGNGRDATQATLASMPDIIFSSTPTGTLPAIKCSGVQFVATGAITQALPVTFSSVLKVTTGGSVGGALGGSSNTYIGQSGSANQLLIAGSVGLVASATDNTWHSLNALPTSSGAGAAINIDGVETTGTTTAAPMGTVVRLCRALGLEFIGQIAEGGIWALTSNSTQRNALSTNQHSTYGY